MRRKVIGRFGRRNARTRPAVDEVFLDKSSRWALRGWPRWGRYGAGHTAKKRRKTAVSGWTSWAKKFRPTFYIIAKSHARLVKKGMSILSPQQLFDPVLHDTVACSGPITVQRARIIVPNGKEKPGRIHSENQAPDREARWLALL